MPKGTRLDEPVDNVLHSALAKAVRDELVRRDKTQLWLSRMSGYSVSSVNNALAMRSMVSTRTWSDFLAVLDMEIGFRRRKI